MKTKPRTILLTRKQVEFVIGKASDFETEMWNNGKPLPGYQFASALCASLRLQHPDCVAQTYQTI